MDESTTFMRYEVLTQVVINGYQLPACDVVQLVDVYDILEEPAATVFRK
jgi:hypothetical protein